MTRRCGESHRYPDFLAARRELLACAAERLPRRAADGRGTRGAEWNRSNQKVVAETIDDQDARTEEAAASSSSSPSLAAPNPPLTAKSPHPAGGALAIAGTAGRGPAARPGQSCRSGVDPGESTPGASEELGYEVFTSTDSLRGRRMQEAARPARDPPAQPKTSAILRLGLMGSLASTCEPSSSEP